MLLVAGCVPFPHRVVDVPQLDGVVHRNGVPVAGVRIYLEPGMKPCSFQGAPLAISDAKGEFHVAYQSSMAYFITMDMFSDWQACIADGERHYLGWHEYRMSDIRRQLRLDCNLEDPQRIWRLGDRGMFAKAVGVCRSPDDEKGGMATPDTDPNL